MLDTQQIPVPQDNQQQEKKQQQQQQMDVDNKPKEVTQPSPPSQQQPQQKSSESNANSQSTSAAKRYNDYIKSLKDLGVTDLFSNKTNPIFLETALKLRTEMEKENKKFIEYADKLKSTKIPLDEQFVNLIRNNETSTPEQLKFNDYVACNVFLLDQKEEENRKLQEEIQRLKSVSTNGKRLQENFESPTKKSRSNDYDRDSINEQQGGKSTFIPYGNKEVFQETRTGELLLKNLLYPRGYFPNFDNDNSDYHDSIINSSRHTRSAMDQIKISNI